MPDTEHNQGNAHRRDRSQPTGDQEHETHVMALVLLSLATIVIITIILSVNREVTDLSPDTYDDEITQPADETHGAGIPVEFAQASEQSGLSGLPSGLPIPDDAEVVRNYESAVGESGTQRVYMYNTSNSVVELVNSYESWINSSSLDITGGDQTNTSVTIRAGNEGEQLIITITTDDGNRQVQVNYINQN